MSIFDILAGSEVNIRCSHCNEKFTSRRPKPLKKKVYEEAQWHLDHMDETVSNIYIYEFSEVVSSTCPHCRNINYLYLDSNHKLFVDKTAPKDTYLAKDLISHWIKKS